MAGFTISCSGNLILFGNSTIIIPMADTYSYTNNAKLWVHHDGQKQRERNESHYSVNNVKTRQTVILLKCINSRNVNC